MRLGLLGIMDCGGKRSATPHWLWVRGKRKRRRRFALPAHSKSLLSTLNFLLTVRGGLRPEVQADGRGVRFVDAQGAAALAYSELTVLDADGRKLPARFEPVAAEGRADCAQPAASDGEAQPTPRRTEDCAPYHESALRLAIDERGARYPLTIDPIAQQAYLKASNTDDGSDHFVVSLSCGTVVVGAPWEGSSARVVNGNQSDNSAWAAGAVFISTGVGLGPSLALGPDGSGGYLLVCNGAPEITYRLQRAPSVTGPWSDLVTNTAPASGHIEYHETSPPPGAAFYRTSQPQAKP